MKIDTEKLRTVSNYAKSINKDRGWIYKLIRAGKIQKVEIDGIMFINLDSI